jgi:ABC-type transport system involved in multi-copper enzyme maturation permease subunit
MKGSTLKALALDALYQVLDNWVFRILVILTCIPVLLFFLIGFREEGISFLFGIWEWKWVQVLEAFDVPAEIPTRQLRTSVIDGLVNAVFWIAGGPGVIFCIAATAFFVPRMIEKGAADILLHKPASRLTFLVARYFAGLLFVGLLSSFLVTGIYLGLLVSSGYHQPGILLAAPLLVYLFGLVLSVTVLIGAVTRSTVASILLGALFFLANGCVHNLWIARDQARGMAAEFEELASDVDEDQVTVELEGFEAPTNGLEVVGDVFVALLNTAHYTLPKTTEADYLARELRAAIDAADFADPDEVFHIMTIPERFRVLDEGPLSSSPLMSAGGDLRGELLLSLEADGGARLGLWRRAKRTIEIPNRRDPTKVRTRSERLRDFVRDFEAAVETEVSGATPFVNVDEAGAPIIEVSPAYEGPMFQNDTKAWSLDGRYSRATFFRKGDWFFMAQVEAAEPAASHDLDALLGAGEFVVTAQNWYAEQLGWDAELRHNYFFSIGSSLAFAAVMLLLAWRKLARIDF